MLISVTQCAGTGLKTSPTGPASTISGKFSFLEDGILSGARGSLRDGGSQVDLILNGEHACSSKAGYGGEGAPTNVNGQSWEVLSSMTYCGGPYPVKKGDTLALNVVYDLKKHPLRKGASEAEAMRIMGMMSLTVVPSKWFP